MDEKHCREMIDRLLDQRGQQYQDKNLILAYQRGLLTGMLAHLMSQDFFVADYVRKVMDHKTRK